MSCLNLVSSFEEPGPERWEESVVRLLPNALNWMIRLMRNLDGLVVSMVLRRLIQNQKKEHTNQ